MIGEIFGIETGFQGSVVSNLAKLNFTSVVETVNEKHMQPWTAMCGEVREWGGGENSGRARALPCPALTRAVNRLRRRASPPAAAPFLPHSLALRTRR